MLELTDIEKFIIALVMINKQDAISLSQNRRADLVEEYSKSLELPDRETLVFDMVTEYNQFKQLLHNAETGERIAYIDNLTPLTKQAKYIYYNIELMFVERLPFDVLMSLKNTFMYICNIKNDNELLEKCKEQTDQVIDFLEYIEKQDLNNEGLS
jgi:hypothetical protein